MCVCVCEYIFIPGFVVVSFTKEERGEVGETRSATKVDKLAVASIESGDGGGSSEEDSEDDDDSDGSEMSL